MFPRDVVYLFCWLHRRNCARTEQRLTVRVSPNEVCVALINVPQLFWGRVLDFSNPVHVKLEVEHDSKANLHFNFVQRLQISVYAFW